MEKDYKKRTAYFIILFASISVAMRIVQIISMVAFPMDFAHPASSPMYWIFLFVLTLGFLPVSLAIQYNAKRAGLKIVRILFGVLTGLLCLGIFVHLFLLFASRFLPELYLKF